MEKLLHAMNKLVFVVKRTQSEVFDVKSLVDEILRDFLHTSKYILALGDILEGDYLENAIGYGNKRIESFVEKSYIGTVMWTSTYHIRYGSGFTPRLATREKYKETIGFNCLGRAILLGSYLQASKHAYQIFLGLNFGTFTDHGLIIIKIRNNYFLCDTEEMKLKKLHGKMNKEKGYIWYEKDLKDNVRFNAIVIQNFNDGMLNAIIGHFIFLKNKSLKDVPNADKRYMTFKDKKYKLKTVIERTPWKKIQTQYFYELNQYRDKYRDKYIAECLLTDLQRQSSELKMKYNGIIKHIFEKSLGEQYTPQKNKVFIEGYMPLLQAKSNRVIAFLEGSNPYLGMHLPKDIHLYLKSLREKISTDRIMKGFVIRRFKERLRA